MSCSSAASEKFDALTQRLNAFFLFRLYQATRSTSFVTETAGYWFVMVPMRQQRRPTKPTKK
jgi:hypothetical protein